MVLATKVISLIAYCYLVWSVIKNNNNNNIEYIFFKKKKKVKLICLIFIQYIL